MYQLIEDLFPCISAFHQRQIVKHSGIEQLLRDIKKEIVHMQSNYERNVFISITTKVSGRIYYKGFPEVQASFRFAVFYNATPLSHETTSFLTEKATGIHSMHCSQSQVQPVSCSQDWKWGSLWKSRQVGRMKELGEATGFRVCFGTLGLSALVEHRS